MKPHFAKPRGAPQRAERNEFPSENALGGALRRPRKFPRKRKKFVNGAYIQFCSHSFYQKFVEKTTPRPAKRGGAETQTRLLGRKKFFWGVGQKEIFCALAAAKIFLANKVWNF